MTKEQEALTQKEADEGAKYWDKRVGELEKRIEAVEKAVNAKDRTGDGKTDKSAGGRLERIEAALGISHSHGDFTVNNEGEKLDEDGNVIQSGKSKRQAKSDDPTAPESDVKAGKA